MRERKLGLIEHVRVMAKFWNDEIASYLVEHPNRYPKERTTMATDRMMQFFEYGHLPEHLKEVSVQFANLATWIVETLPQNPERTVALRKLMEAKDCAVRTRLYKEPE